MTRTSTSFCAASDQATHHDSSVHAGLREPCYVCSLLARSHAPPSTAILNLSAAGVLAVSARAVFPTQWT